jgi:hypothetical protein
VALPRPRVPLTDPRDPLAGVDAANLRLPSSSSRRRRASSRRCSSSAALRWAASCRCRASASCSATSSVAPFQAGLRMRRWLCSVCDNIRVHVLSSTEALFTVLETVWKSGQLGEAWVLRGSGVARTSMFPPARSRVAITPSRLWLMFRTPSSSLRNAASWSIGSCRSGLAVGVFGVLGVLGRGSLGGASSLVDDAQISDSVCVVSSAMVDIKGPGGFFS